MLAYPNFEQESYECLHFVRIKPRESIYSHDRILKDCFENLDTQEISSLSSDLPQNLTPGRSGHAGSESGVQNLEIRHPEAKIKESQPKISV